jgi:hypothetical protein
MRSALHGRGLTFSCYVSSLFFYFSAPPYLHALPASGCHFILVYSPVQVSTSKYLNVVPLEIALVGALVQLRPEWEQEVL